MPEARGGRLLADDALDEDAAVYQDAVYRCAREIIGRAAERPVVFALLAGRRRTMTVMAVVVAQHLARPQDLVVDVRIEPSDAEQPGVFFFPEQPRRALHTRHGSVDSRDVQVHVVDVRVPRLRGLVDANDASTYRALL
ncbi:MAG: hypothetical protein IT459_17025, partial [Planctomycetes bacterium]|nr:hypothetical protein [Planctomycetota bacterium]